MAPDRHGDDAEADHDRELQGDQRTAHERLRNHVVAIVVLTIGVDLIAAVLAFLFEHDQRGTQIRSFGSAIFWTTTQLLTVSSQLPNPISVGGRILDVFLEMWAVTVGATPGH